MLGFQSKFTAYEQNPKDGHTQVVVKSIMGPLFSRIKFYIATARKNQALASNPDFAGLISALGEQIVPQNISTYFTDTKEIFKLHNYVFLLAQKCKGVFHGSVIHTCIDQNWDLKGLKQSLQRLIQHLQINNATTQKASQLIEELIQEQNVQSAMCMKAMRYFLRKKDKRIEEDDLENPIRTYQTCFEFIEQDITRFRQQNLQEQCFDKLHPYQYDIEKVDLRYMINNRLIDLVCKSLGDTNSAIFWLSYFKTKAAVSADDFFLAIQEISMISGGSFKLEDSFRLMVQQEFCVAIEDKDFISQQIASSVGQIDIFSSQVMASGDVSYGFIDVSNSSKYTMN
jgi:hypothetical protein